MLDIPRENVVEDYDIISDRVGSYIIGGNRVFWICKRLFDVLMSLALLPILLFAGLALLFLNQFWNKGSLFFVQKRMGKDCEPFQAIKFRTMTHANKISRGHEDPVENERITPLGHFLRKIRLDELPQILNVIAGNMSLIGPRPDYIDHAIILKESILGYSERHMIRPGISGLAQVEIGYVEGIEMSRKKVAADHFYIQNSGFSLECLIVFKTVLIVVMYKGK